MPILLQWHNLVFLLPLGIAILLLLAQAAGMLHFDGDGEVEHEIDHGHENEAEHVETEGGYARTALDILGVGKVPLGIILNTLTMVFGFVGLASNQILAAMKLPISVAFWIALALAIAISVSATGLLARLLSRLLPNTVTSAMPKSQLVGCAGEAVYCITQTSGFASVRDVCGTLHEVPVRIFPGEEEIPAASQVVLMDYDEVHDLYYVRNIKNAFATLNQPKQLNRA